MLGKFLGKLLGKLLGLLLFGAVLAVFAMNFRTLLYAGEAHLVDTSARSAIQSGNWDRAIELYEGGLRSYPNNPTLALRLAELYTRGEQTDKAMPLYQSILRKNPENTEARMGIAAIHGLSTEHRNDAVIELRKVLKKHADHPALLTQLGDLYKTAAENPLETREPVRQWLYDYARYYYQHALRWDPGQFRTQFNLGVAYHRRNHLQSAAQTYCRAILLNLHSYEARYNLGLALSELNYLEEAYLQMRLAVQLASEQSGKETAMAIAQRVQNVKNRNYYNAEKKGLSAQPPTFLDAQCRVSPTDTWDF